MSTLVDWIKQQLGASRGSLAEVIARIFVADVRQEKQTDDEAAGAALAVLKLLLSGVTPPPGLQGVDRDEWMVRYFSYWQGVIGEMKSGGSAKALTAVEVVKLVEFLGNNTGSLMGPQMQELFSLFSAPPSGAGAAVDADEVARVIQRLAPSSTPLAPAQILTLVRTLLAPPFGLTPRQLVQLLDVLVPADTTRFSPPQVEDLIKRVTPFCQSSTCTPLSFLALFQGALEQGVAADALLQFFTRDYTPLTPGQVMSLAIDMGVDAAGKLLTATDSLSTIDEAAAAARGFNAVSRVIVEAWQAAQLLGDAGWPRLVLAIVSLFPQLKGNRDRVATRIRRFVADVTAAIAMNHTNNRGWTDVMSLVQDFIASGRLIALLPPAPCDVTISLSNGITVLVTGERQQFFLRGHTLQFADFGITDRTADNMTFWPTATFDGLTGWIGGLASDSELQHLAVNAEAPSSEGTDTIGRNATTVGDFQVLLVESPDIGTVSLVDFMPSLTAESAVVVHKDLLAALAFLFDETAI